MKASAKIAFLLYSICCLNNWKDKALFWTVWLENCFNILSHSSKIIMSNLVLSSILCNDSIEQTIFFISPYLFFSRRRGHLNFEIFAKNGPKIDFLGHPTPKLVARSILTANLDSPSNLSPNRAFWEKNNFLFDKNFLLKDLIYCSTVSIGNFKNRQNRLYGHFSVFYHMYRQIEWFLSILEFKLRYCE